MQIGSMAASGNFFSGFIKKFDGDEFQVWKCRMEALLKAEGLWDIVVGEEKPPCNGESSGEAHPEGSEVVDNTVESSEPPISVKEAAEEVRREALAYCTLLQGLKGNPARRVRTAKTAKEVWDRLLAVYESRNMFNTAYLSKKFYKSRMVEGEPVFEYIDRVRLIADELGAIGFPVPEKDKVYVLLEGLSGLSESLDAVRISLQTSKRDTDFEIVSRILIEDELRSTVWRNDDDADNCGHEGERYRFHRGAHGGRNRTRNARDGLF